MQQLSGPYRPERSGHARCKIMGMQRMRWHSRPGRQCCEEYLDRGEVVPVRLRKQALAISYAAEPGISPAQGREKRTEGGGMNTGIKIFDGGGPNASFVELPVVR